jgi:hypothetical protein
MTEIHNGEAAVGFSTNHLIFSPILREASAGAGFAKKVGVKHIILSSPSRCFYN